MFLTSRHLLGEVRFPIEAKEPERFFYAWGSREGCPLKPHLISFTEPSILNVFYFFKKMFVPPSAVDPNIEFCFSLSALSAFPFPLLDLSYPGILFCSLLLNVRFVFLAPLFCILKLFWAIILN